MYQKYHTDALVLGSRESGEADRTVVLYTRDFGLVRARASAIRHERSKMRYALQHYSRAHVALVRGKSGWRLAGAQADVGVQEAHAYLFEVLSEAHGAFMREACEHHATIELVCVARILYALGYISAEALETALFTHTAYTDVHLQEAEAMRGELLSSINRAISETHL